MRIPRWIVGLVVLSLVTAGVATPAQAQNTPGAELSGGYQFINLSAEGEGESLPAGWYVDVAGHVNPILAAVFQIGGNYKSITESAFGATATATVRVHEFLGGVRVSGPANTQVVPFGQVLVGGVNGSIGLTGSVGNLPVISLEESGTNFALQVGGGVNMWLTDAVGVRAGADYLRVFAEDVDGNLVRIGAGAVFRFGR